MSCNFFIKKKMYIRASELSNNKLFPQVSFSADATRIALKQSHSEHILTYLCPGPTS